MRTSSTNVVVTGGDGLIGSHLDEYIRVGRDDADLTNPVATDKLFERLKPKYVVHCAGRVGGVGGNNDNKGYFFYDNVMINTNVLHSAMKHGVKRLVTFLSTCVFPDDVALPIDESKIHLGEPHKTNYPYAYSKRLMEVQCRAYKEQFGCDFVCLVPTNLYGPNDNFNIQTGHVIPSLIHKCFLARTNNTDFVVWGTGIPVREFIYVGDLIPIIKWALFDYKRSTPVIVSNPNDTISIGSLVEMICRLMDYDKKVLWDHSKPDGQHRKPSCNQKLLEEAADTGLDIKFTSLHDGLKKTIDWFEENYDKGNVRY
jgi:GDP-L-fucose synthase